MPTTTAAGGASLYYEVHGAGAAVLFVHGSGGHHAAWWQQVAALRGKYTVITMDLLASGVWQGKGVLGPEAFDPDPFMAKMAEYDFPYGMQEM